HHAQQDRDGARAATRRRDDAGARRLAHRRRRPRGGRPDGGGGVSSLGLSLLLLVALAVAVALVYNLRQARPRLRWPGELRWPGLRRGKPDKAGTAEARPTTRRMEPQPVRAAGGAFGGAADQRGE